MASILNATTSSGLVTSADNSGSLQLATNNGTTAVTITTAQKVGIGTSSPDAQLHATAQVLAGVNGSNSYIINSAGADYGFISNPSSGVFALGYGATIGTLGTSVATWNSSGNFAFNSGYGSVATAYGCRAWVNFNGTGTPAIRASGNVSSLTDHGTGDYSVNFTTAMPNANFCGNATASNEGPSNRLYVSQNENPMSASAWRIACWNESGSTVDSNFVHVSIFR